LTTLGLYGPQILSIAVGSRNQFMVSGSADKTLRLWHIPSGRPLTTFNTCVDVYNVLALRRKGDAVIIAALADRRKKKKLILLKSLNVITTNKRENF